MVDIFPDVVQVVVLSSGTDAFLSVGRAPQLGHGMRRVDGVQEDRLELSEKINDKMKHL